MSLNPFQFVASTLLAAAQDVVDELNKSTQPLPRKSMCVFGRLVLCGLPARLDSSSSSSSASSQHKDLHPLRSMQPLDGPEHLRALLGQHFSPADEEEPFVYFAWNLSGVPWDAVFCEVVEYDFPGRPIPPLGALAEMCQAIAQFIRASERHVAVVHDVSGRRSAVVVACVMHLLGENTGDVLRDVVCPSMGSAGRALVPSQLRYFDYFVKGQDITAPPVVCLKRIIVNGVPRYPSAGGVAGCEPSFRVYDGRGKELGSSSAAAAQFVPASDASFVLVPQTSNVPLQGDVLVRVFTGGGGGGGEQAMFAFAFHTSFLDVVSDGGGGGGGGGVLRLALEELDGTQTSSSGGKRRFPEGMFVDVMYGRVVEEEGATRPPPTPTPTPPPAPAVKAVAAAPPAAAADDDDDEAALWREIDDALQEDTNTSSVAALLDDDDDDDEELVLE